MGAGGGGVSPGRMVHNLVMPLFSPTNSKIKVFETYFFDIVCTQKDHRVRYVVGNIYVFFTSFGY